MKPMIQQLTIDTNVRISRGERHSTLVANSLLLRHLSNGKSDIQLKNFFYKMNTMLCDPEPLSEDEINQIWESATEYVSRIRNESPQNNVDQKTK